MGETLVLSRDQAVQDHAAAPVSPPVATGFAGLFKRPAARWARVALVAVNLAAVTAFLLSYSRHGVGFGPFRIDLAAYRAGGHTWLHRGNLYGQADSPGRRQPSVLFSSRKWFPSEVVLQRRSRCAVREAEHRRVLTPDWVT